MKIIQATKPKVAIAENVKALASTKFKSEFAVVLSSLSDAGYNNYWHIMNAKDYGIPQNRDRIFIVSIRKDVDAGRFEFPLPTCGKPDLRSFLEHNADEKYYLSEYLSENEPVFKIIEHFYKSRPPREYTEYAPTLRANRHGLKVHEPYIWDGFNQAIRSDSTTVGTITCNVGANLSRNGQGVIERVNNRVRVRNLTPKECFRLMGFTDTDFEKARAVSPETQVYKQAGNSIVVTCLEALFENLLKKRCNNLELQNITQGKLNELQ